jgi:phosphatidylethanolamine/phosphatidyl-N-methylethanolamine N-methyltransferase
VQELPGEGQYDVIVSGLPMNNFSVELVESILGACRRLLAPGGTFSYFEYIAVRPMRAMISRQAERQRLRGLDHILGELLARHEFSRQAVLTNLPPAWVHHLRLDKVTR